MHKSSNTGGCGVTISTTVDTQIYTPVDDIKAAIEGECRATNI